MGQHIAFLRAVNVGKRTTPMATLKAVTEDLGYTDVWTYINSGNVVFSASGKRADLEGRLEDRFEAEFGFVVETFVRTAAELRSVGAAKPFPMPDGHTHMVTFFRDVAPPTQVAALEGLSNGVDLLVVAGREVHWRIKGTVMTSELKPKDWAGTGIGPSTSRNLNGLRKLIAKLD
jgi:uncharacterized protein (DUF1697 family)